jgi:hypothetical protein
MTGVAASPRKLIHVSTEANLQRDLVRAILA